MTAWCSPPGEEMARTLSATRAILGCILISLVLAWAGPSPALSSSRDHRAKCSGPASPGGSFHLAADRKLRIKHLGCGKARKLVKAFPSRCTRAYAGQGSCKVRASGRWRCRSRMVGPLTHGAPAKEHCRHKRGRVVFKVTYAPPTEPVLPLDSLAGRKAAAAADGPIFTHNCIDTTVLGKVFPPPPPAYGNFLIHLLDGVPKATGVALQKRLVALHVEENLRKGLGAGPRTDPGRLQIYLVPGKFIPDNAYGITAQTCADPVESAIVIRTDVPPAEITDTAAHELFHAHSEGVLYVPFVPWWEEASATWSVTRSNLPPDDEYDPDLQFPQYPLDTEKIPTYRYAMSRFVEFLDDRTLIGETTWPLQRRVIAGYRQPGTNAALAEGLASEGKGVSLGEELGAFWGDRLRAHPRRGPQLRPVRANSTMKTVKPGSDKLRVSARHLAASLVNFKLSKGVERVEFSFDPPADGYFWGLVDPDTSQPLKADDSISFCVGGSNDQDLEWPPTGSGKGGHFPVIFTDGSLDKKLTGTITIRAQSDAAQCGSSTPANHACKLLRKARVHYLLGPGTFPYSSESEDTDGITWICIYHGGGRDVDLNLIKAKKLASKQVRKNAKRQIAQLGLDPLRNVGDVAGIGVFDDGQSTYSIVVMAIGREIALFTLGPGPSHRLAVQLAKGLNDELD